LKISFIGVDEFQKGEGKSLTPFYFFLASSGLAIRRLRMQAPKEASLMLTWKGRFSGPKG
jgi:hypothetical protein